jgi:hypothetical protein
MTDRTLSPQAQAVLDAVGDCYKEDIPEDRDIIIAALRAAADCLWVDKSDGANGVYETHRAQLLAIATELETQ